MAPFCRRGGEDLKRHGGGVFTYHAPVSPDAVVYPQGRDEVLEILRFANAHRVPIVPFGQGSSLEAHTLPAHGGISLDLGRMDRVLEIRPDAFIARVHGIGVRKTACLQKEHGDSLPFMREIKRIADPNGIMNPGKIFGGV